MIDWHNTGGTTINTITVGTCSLCGGPVTLPTVYYSTMRPRKTCSKCGAVALDDYGPTIPMVKPGEKR